MEFEIEEERPSREELCQSLVDSGEIIPVEFSGIFYPVLARVRRSSPKFRPRADSFGSEGKYENRLVGRALFT